MVVEQLAPCGRRTRWISASARSPSNQWNACPTVTASAEPSGSGIDSAVPSSARMPGMEAASLARMAATGSTATRVAPYAASILVSFPVPAPRSTTTVPGATPSASASQATAGTG